MAHAIETRNGKVSFMEVSMPDKVTGIRPQAWHELTKPFPDYLNLEQTLNEAGLAWETEKVPILNQKTGKVIPGQFAVTRDVDGATLGVVGERYTIVQPRTTFEIGETIMGDEAQWETAGSLHGGSSIFGLARLRKELYIAGEEIDPFFLIENSYDGSKAMRLTLTPIRVVCQNTLNMAMRGSKRIVSIRHTPNYESTLDEARKTLGLVKHYYENFEAQANNLLKQAFTKSQFEQLTEQLFAIREDAPKREKTNAENNRETLLKCYEADDIDNIRGTAWGAFNAVADYSDHYQKTRGLKGREARERDFERAMHDTDIKDEALKLILAKA